jgi:hypothetical protein
MLNPDFREMLSCLKDKGVEFIIVGAYALAAHDKDLVDIAWLEKNLHSR